MLKIRKIRCKGNFTAPELIQQRPPTDFLVLQGKPFQAPDLAAGNPE
jgi:hypothetical protein